MDREDIKKLIQMWWDIYDDKSLDYENEDDENETEHEIEKMKIIGEEAKLGPFVTALAGTAIHQNTAPSAA